MREPPQSGDEPGLFLDDEPAPRGAGDSAAPGARAGAGAHAPGAVQTSALAPGDAAASAPPWRILIVDDDVDVHVVTKFALSSASFQGRRLSFVHAYSSGEALAKLREDGDIALVLLDVIMETPDAGLRLARQVRDQLCNKLVRIVLRTGQPGQAVEHSIIVDYDINDFWSKADLTTRKLFTTVIAALRAYATLADAAAERDSALRRLADVQSQLDLAREASAMVVLGADGVLKQCNGAAAALLAHADTGSADADADAGADPAGEAAPADPADQAGTGRPENAPAAALARLRSAVDGATLAAIGAALDAGGAWTGIVTLALPQGPRRLRCACARKPDGDIVVFAAAAD